jgi:hypothetical protein
MQEIVECRSDTSYAERPMAFYWQGQRLVVAALLASWRTPQEKWFRVSLPDGQIFELGYSEDLDRWNIAPK